MKKFVLTFLIISALILLLLPIYNLTQWNRSLIEYFTTKQYYKLDSVTAPVSNILSKFGISLFPDQVIVGNDGWLFLGDQESNTVSNRRLGASDNDVESAKKIAIAMQEWNKFFLDNGVKEFKVLIGPDKEIIYKEHLPKWAYPSEYRQISAVIDADKNGIFVDPTKYLIEQKQNFKEPLYYKTDTHWNALGGWLAFDYFMSKVFDNEKYHAYKTGKYVGWNEKQGGDLSRFLRTENITTDHYQNVDVISNDEINISRYDLKTNSLISSGVNVLIDAPDNPIRIISKNARNKAKVLWLRDSFGTAMSPFMAASFSDVVQLHYFGSNPEWLYEVIKTYKPDYVFVTSVERSIINNFFLSPPPPSALKYSTSENGIEGKLDITHDIKTNNKEYIITGGDPFAVYEFDPKLITNEDNLYLNVSCNRSDSDLMIQIFWSTNNDSFSEENSINLISPQRGAIINLSKIIKSTEPSVKLKIRLDIQPESISDCMTFKINTIQLIHPRH